MKFVIPLLTVLLCISAAQTAEIHVPADHPTIQTAVDAATDGDTVIVTPGVYKENINFKGKAIEVRSQQPANWDIVKSTVIDGSEGNSSCVVFETAEGAESILSGFTLTGGAGTNVEVFRNDTCGGGVLCLNASPTIERCNITKNGPADRGGGVALVGACEAELRSCFITNNVVSTRGPGIFVKSSTPETSVNRILNCTIADNFFEYERCSYNLYQARIVNSNSIISGSIIYGGNDIENGEMRSVWINSISQITYSCFDSLFTHETGTHDPYELPHDSTNIEAVPHFVKRSLKPFSSEVGDYHITNLSPCMNAGNPEYTAESRLDIDGQQRVTFGVVDIGADEVIPFISVDNPQVASVWAAGSTRKVRWQAFEYDGPVDIMYSIDGGQSWMTIASAQENTGEYQWTLPDVILSNQCVVGVFAAGEDPVGIEYKYGGPFTAQPISPDPATDSAWPSLGGGSDRSGSSLAVGPEVGCVKWKLETEGAFQRSVAVGSDGNVHAACGWEDEYETNDWEEQVLIREQGGKVYTVDPEGTVLWAFETESPVTSSPSVGPDGTVYFGDRDGTLYAVDKNGMVRWTQNVDGPMIASPAVAADGRVFAACTDGTVRAFEWNGSDLWKFELPMLGQISDEILASPAIDDERLYFSSVYNPYVYALNLDTGEIEWTTEIPEAEGFFVSPVVTPDGNVLINALDDKTLYALACDTGEVAWSVDLYDLAESSNLVTPVAHWPFEDGTTDVIEGYTSYLEGDLVNTKPAVGEGCISLREHDELNINSYPGVIGSQARTVSVWVKAGRGDIFDYGRREQGKRWRLFFEGDELALGIGGAAIYVDSNLSSRSWHRVTTVLADTENPTVRDISIYIDGVKREPRFSNPDTLVNTADYRIYVGNNLPGQIDDLRFYDFAMDQDLIRKTYLAQKASGRMYSEPAVAADGTVYLSMDSPTLCALNADGSLKWSSHLGQVGGYSLAVGNDGLVYAAGDDGSVYVVSPDGEELARFDGQGRLSYPAVGEGMLYAGDEAGAVWAIGADGCSEAMQLHRPVNIAADGAVNLSDLAVLASDWLNTFCLDSYHSDCTCGGIEVEYFQGDVNRDLSVDNADLMELIENWLATE
ncbi:Outer membrane protein assembly factor BamB precursor [Anaerohalosphaera lusitana]|uniref:Outer membrane protein assembly factor BamB n=1 Tax=Anaerohalosphaera lusitana TaxID=1936003 RepID=A0A1U9NI14_9BACT|nr:PQQ-binding-like beta-propeller repeat protein [Anaerohalosphaera lusitana]AQT67569.1 Outer membrane protein assembly factor BamB precursor [Anaerohalosphaera lusitana]